uniref:Uncharacterized protein n=1 Tax=viral metagenome TaxID=1070528 RepID=A0A6C0BBG0_9ZZZZ
MAKTKRNRRMRKKTQKVWPMHGCYKQRGGGCGCGVQMGGVRQMGGRRRLKGGMTLSPSPFVNSPTLPGVIQTWPGVQGAGTGNWLTKNQLYVDPTIRTSVQERGGSVSPFQMGGRKEGGRKEGKRKEGGRRTKKGRSKKGGFDLVNMGMYGIQNAYSTLIGSGNMPVNPQPTVQFVRK